MNEYSYVSHMYLEKKYTYMQGVQRGGNTAHTTVVLSYTVRMDSLAFTHIHLVLRKEPLRVSAFFQPTRDKAFFTSRDTHLHLHISLFSGPFRL